MILAFDTYYFLNPTDTGTAECAKTVCVSFRDWTDDQPLAVNSEIITDVLPYESGAFYKRELPCILSLLKSLLKQYNLNDVTAIIVDGYVLLNDTGKLGLGGYLYQALDKKIPIIGVAKSKFKENTKYVHALTRGNSKKPLFISTQGMMLELAVKHIQNMHGNYRVPTLLQILDTTTKAKH